MTIGEIRHACEAYGPTDHVPKPAINTARDDAEEDDFETDLVRNANEIIGPAIPTIPDAAAGDFETDDTRPCKCICVFISCLKLVQSLK